MRKDFALEPATILKEAGHSATEKDALLQAAESGLAGMEPKWLPIYIQDRSNTFTLVNVDVTVPPASDQEFFRILKQTHDRNWNWMRRLFGRVTAIKFILLEPPEEVRLGNWIYLPFPLYFFILMDSEAMVDYFHHPKDAATDLRLSEQVPKKLRAPVSYDDS